MNYEKMTKAELLKVIEHISPGTRIENCTLTQVSKMTKSQANVLLTLAEAAQANATAITAIAAKAGVPSANPCIQINEPLKATWGS